MTDPELKDIDALLADIPVESITAGMVFVAMYITVCSANNAEFATRLAYAVLDVRNSSFIDRDVIDKLRCELSNIANARKIALVANPALSPYMCDIVNVLTAARLPVTAAVLSHLGDKHVRSIYARLTSDQTMSTASIETIGDTCAGRWFLTVIHALSAVKE